MKQIYFEELDFSNSEDSYAKVKDVIPLIMNNQFYEELMLLFNIETIKNETIKIAGAKELIDTILNYDKEYIKSDINAYVKNIDIVEIQKNGDITLSVENSSKSKINALIMKDPQIEYFNLFGASKYFDFSIKHNRNDIIYENWDKIKEYFGESKTYEKKFRIISDKKLNYIRAITSPSRYFNYDNKFATFVSLIVLHNDMKENGNIYKLDRCYLSDSRINIKFKFANKVSKGRLDCNFIIEASNDEIKKEAFNFSGIRKIQIDTEDHKGELIVKSSKLNSRIFSVRHNVLPETVMKEIINIQDVERIEKELLKEWNELLEVKNPDELKDLLFRKLDKAKHEGIKPYKSEIKKLKQRGKINHMYELLVIMDKVSILVSDIEGKDYLAYLFNEVLFEHK